MPPEVLQVRSSAGMYGADHAVLTLSQALPGAGITSRMLCIENYQMDSQPLHERARELAIDSQLLACHGRLDLTTLRGIKDQLRNAPGAILNVHDYKSAFYAWLATRQVPAPLVATMHGWIETTHALRVYKRLELMLLRRFSHVVVVTDALRPVLQRAGIAPTRISMIANGVDTTRFTPETTPAARAEFDLPRSAFLFGSVARLAPEKNLASLVDAVGKLIHEGLDIALLLIGEGPERGSLEDRIQSSNLGDRIRLAGTRSDTHRIYPMLDCFVLPSLTEGMPLCVLEAMACARPVIASAVGEIPRLLAASASGRVVPPGDMRGLVAALRAASTERVSDAMARRYVETRCSVATMAVQYADLYCKLRGAGHGRAVI